MVRARGPGDLLAADVGLDLRLPQHAGVDEQRLGALLAEAVAQERVLVALGVQRADEHHEARRAGMVSPLDAEPAALGVGVVGELAAVVSAKIRPATMTSWRSASAVATARFCSTTRMARPSCASR